MKKTISCLLLIAMLASLAACGGTESSADTTNSGSTDTTTAAETLPANIEKSDFGGEKFNILAPKWGLYENYFFTDEQNGEAMNDAIYDRDNLIEEYLNVDMTYQLEGTIQEIMGKVQAAVMSGDDTYQLVLTHCMYNVANMVTSELLYDFNELPSLNMEADWWNTNANKNLEVAGKQFFAVSDYMIPDPNCVLFNKDFIDQYKLENPYELVRDGKWTLDKMIEMMGKVTKDLNGDSKMDISDQYGLGTPNNWFLSSFLYSSNIFMADKNDKGEYVLTLGDEKTFDLMEKMHALLNGSDTFVYGYGEKDETKTLKISANRSLFQIETLNQLHLLRDTTVDFGILPYPKYDEAQEDYYNNDWSGLMCVPVTVKNTDKVGKVIELLAYYSGTTTLPAYHELVLGEKLSRDEDSKEMLELIFNNIVFDGGMNYFCLSGSMQSLFYGIHNQIFANKTADFASYFEKHKEAAEAQIATFNKAVAEID